MAKSKTPRYLRGGIMIYTLIMTIYVTHYHTGLALAASTATAEFDSEKACRYAGAQQEVALRNDFKLNTDKYYTFICVPK